MSQRRPYRPRQRRGVLRLVVLSMLVIFVLIAITFVLVANQEKDAAKAAGKRAVTGTDPKRLLDGAMYQLLRDTKDTQLFSAIRGHSLLRDLYGDDAAVGRIDPSAVPQYLAGGQLLELRVRDADLRGVRPTLPPRGHYNGCVLTFLDGDARGISVRIVHYEYNAAQSLHIFRVMRPDADLPIAVTPQPEDRFRINGRPFNGTGFGYNVTTRKLDATVNVGGTQRAIALLPSHYAVDYTSVPNRPYLFGGADESYDAPDYQNVLLGAVIPPDPTVPGSKVEIIPSLHRPALLNYWSAQASPLETNQPLLRSVMLRPNWLDHPKFTGSNPAFETATSDQARLQVAINGPWDVDNDGDGLADSVWVDLGYPVARAKDGRLYKPLFAVLCVDLDGRLNLNAHGTRGHYDTPLPRPAQNLASAGGVTDSQSANLPRGDGYGTPEINLGPVPGGTGLLSVAEYRALLEGDAGRRIPGRNGADRWPGKQDDYTSAGWRDLLSQIALFEFPDNYFTSAVLSAYQSPPDLRGRLAFGLGYRGQPIYEQVPPGIVDNRQDTPYDLDLSWGGPRGASPLSAANNPDDAPYSAAELERLLRAYDADASALPSRLWDLIPAFGNPLLAGGPSPEVAREKRLAVTTDSYDLPVPNVLVPKDLRDFIATRTAAEFPRDRPLNVADLLRARLLQGGFTGNIDTELAKDLDPEVLRGLRMNVNRPFGNGRDDTAGGNPGVGVVDDPLEAGTENVWTDPTVPVSFQGVPFDVLNNDPALGGTNPERRARQILARHLYLLMMAIKDRTAEIDFDGDGNTSSDETARGIAQWAINVVDFRDADSIMTPFEYDKSPFNANGWQVDGDLSTTGETDRGVVWGCERPELLITETLAFHDRRTEDRNDAGAGDEYTANHPSDPGSDPNFDQRLRPRSGLFVELYNPWTGSTRTPGEFYVDNSGTRRDGVLLNKVNTQGSPVWRLVVIKQELLKDPDFDPAAPNQTPGQVVENRVERTVYFTNDPSALTVPPNDPPRSYYTDLPIAPLKPGRYAVIGPADNDATPNGPYLSTIGLRTDANLDPGAPDVKHGTTQRIRMIPNSNPDTHQVDVFRNSATPDYTAPGEIDPVIAVAIDRPSPLSISEPVRGYNETQSSNANYDPQALDGEGIFLAPYDQPLDIVNPDLMQDTTHQDYRRVLLQRLANPLLAWNDVTNPYLTIDAASVNLTVFNGVTNENDPSVSQNNNTGIGTLERGKRNDVAANATNLWRVEPPGPPDPSPALASHYFDKELVHSLGYINRSYRADPSTAPVPGDPQQPFSWLTWNNRPFISQLELLMVPKSHSSRLLYQYTMATGAAMPLFDAAQASGWPFQHLLNAFEVRATGAPQVNLYGIFEFLHVPSRFVRSRRYLDPGTFRQGGPVGTETLHAPFNTISNYRDPGRVNINTIFDRRVWEGMMNGVAGPSWQNLIDSRRGYTPTGAGTGMLRARQEIPTFFANPFRSFGAGDLVPPLTPPANLERAGIECTLLRSNAVGDPAAGNNAVGSTPLFEAQSTALYNQTDRNPYFRYQALTRLGNLVTTRSNVYAVWITVGFFEVEPTPIDGAHPDGVRLAQELGAETGQVTRHRAFYIIDRSIPVAFEPGVNHNVDKAVVLRRLIE